MTTKWLVRFLAKNVTLSGGASSVLYLNERASEHVENDKPKLGGVLNKCNIMSLNLHSRDKLILVRMGSESSAHR